MVVLGLLVGSRAWAADTPAGNPRPKILVVMSYAVDYEWCQAIRRGLDTHLGASCDLYYEYLDSRKSPDGAAARAAAAFARYQRLAPDGVIAADDNAQRLFVRPYLANKVATPVVFCGVNAEPSVYAYPANNVTGVLERYHISETIALLQQLVPSVRRVAFVGVDSPTGRPMIKQAREELADGGRSDYRFELVNSLGELEALLAALKEGYDAIYLSLLQGIRDANGAILSTRRLVRTITTRFGKPVVSAAPYDLPHGVLCAVVHTGEEQGRLAADLMGKALAGTPIDQLPITRNYNGRRIINVSAMQALNIKARPILLRGASLIRNAP